MMSKAVFYMNISEKIILLIDNSNTRTKFIYSQGGKLMPPLLVIPTAELSVQRVRAAVQHVSFSHVVVSSVVPSCVPIFSEAFTCPVHFVSASSPMSMTFDYEGMSTLGADRIANALAACDRWGESAVIIDAGTATTFDVVLLRGEHFVYVGGVIAPGAGVFTSYLHQKTALLPDVKAVDTCAVIAKNTVQAIQAGAFYGFGGMVRTIAEQIQSELGQAVRVVLTGGDGERLVQDGFVKGEYDKYLTFYGLLHVAARL